MTRNSMAETMSPIESRRTSARCKSAIGHSCLSAIASGSIALSTGIGIQTPAQAAAPNFSCGVTNGTPATVVTTTDGRSVTMIRWSSNVFDGGGWTPERRCQEVSQRFEGFRQQCRLQYLTTGRINGQPVICTAKADGATWMDCFIPSSQARIQPPLFEVFLMFVTRHEDP